MADLTETKTKLDTLYKEYKRNKSTLNNSKTNEVISLLKELSQNGSTKDVAEKLVVFSEKVCRLYFDELTRGSLVDIDIVESIINDFISVNTDTGKERFYVKKYATMVIKVVNNYLEKAYESKTLAKLVALVAYIALKSDENRLQFKRIIQETEGKVYNIDFSLVKKNSLDNVNRITVELIDDNEIKKYISYISDFWKKYGFTEETPPNNPSVSNDETAPSMEALVRKLYLDIKNDLSRERESVISAVTELTAPFGKTLDDVQEEIRKSRETAAENIRLKSRVEELERQVSEQTIRIEESENTFRTLRLENDDLNGQIAVLESRNSELDSKLNEAYSINSRESSLEAEKIRSELKKSFSFLYMDWLEYEFSDVSEENYESLQAIIKKTFRSLERNGIDFKGNNE